MKFFQIACLGLLIAFSVPAHAETINFKKLMAHFNSVVFVHEHGKQGKEAKPLVKWDGPIIVGVGGTFRPENISELLNVFRRVEKLTGLDVNVDQVTSVMSLIKKEITPDEFKNRNLQKPNFVVRFEKREVLKQEFKAGVNCKGTLSGNKDFVIKRANATIPFDFQPKTSHCIVEETVQLLGLTNDSTIIANSIFNDNSDIPTMSVADQILLKALYDQRLRPGMSREEAEPIVQTVLRDIVEKAKARRSSN